MPRFEPPGACRLWAMASKAAPDLEQPIRPLAVVLPWLLGQIEAALANDKTDTAEK